MRSFGFLFIAFAISVIARPLPPGDADSKKIPLSQDPKDARVRDRTMQERKIARKEAVQKATLCLVEMAGTPGMSYQAVMIECEKRHGQKPQVDEEVAGMLQFGADECFKNEMNKNLESNAVLVSHKYIEAECKKMFNTNPKVNPAKLQDAADKFAEKEYNRLKARNKVVQPEEIENTKIMAKHIFGKSPNWKPKQFASGLSYTTTTLGKNDNNNAMSMTMQRFQSIPDRVLKAANRASGSFSATPPVFGQKVRALGLSTL